jgi:hypothetical protein
MSVAEILRTHPLPLITDVGALAACIDECTECAARCDELLAALGPGLTQRSS